MPGIFKVICFFPLFIFHTGLAQDLVPNGDFEGKKGKPTARPWMFANTVDYFIYHKAGASGNPADKNQKLRKAHSGKGYIGIRSWSVYREYAQIKLSVPLHEGKKYSFKMYLAVSPYCNSITKEIGINFSKSAISAADNNVIEKTIPQIEFSLSRKYKDSTEWFAVTGTFTAKGGEQFLTIGCFTDKEKIHLVKKNPLYITLIREAYYYVDDVSLFELDDSGKEITETPVITSKQIPGDTVKQEVNYFEKQAEKKSTIVMKNIYFASAKADLLPESYDELGLLIDLLNDNPQMKIEIVGHTDNTGDEEKNKKLSFNRAESVVKYLVDNGIREDRLTFSGKGSEDPITTNDNEEGKQENRRVEFVIVKK